MQKNSKIYIAGHRGLVGSAILRKLQAEGYTNIIFRASEELNLRDQLQTNKFFAIEKPEYVFLAAAKVGGVAANSTYPADFLYANLTIQNSVIHNAYLYGVKKLMFMGSNCLYPKDCPQPIKEEYLLTGPLEPSTEAYAIAKIAGIKMCQAYRTQYGCNFITILPVNLYGPNDNYDLSTSHVMPALLKKFKNAKDNNLPSVEIWGSGNARREFLHVNDLADAALFVMLNYNEAEPINIGSGTDIPIWRLVNMIKEISGYQGDIIFDKTKPEGNMSKLLDSDKISKLGWAPRISLLSGVTKEYNRL